MEHIYIGANSNRGSGGVYRMELDTDRGVLRICSEAQAYNAGVLCRNPEAGVLYALSEGMTFLGKASGGIYTVSAGESPPVITGRTATGGQRPCAVCVKPWGGELQDGQPRAGEPQASRSWGGEPQVDEPQASQPWAGEPRASRSWGGEPQVDEPQASQPRAGETQANQLSASQPQAGELAVGHFLGGFIAIFGLSRDGSIQECKNVIRQDSPSAKIHHVAYSPLGGHLLALEVKGNAIHVYDRKNGFREVYRERMGDGVFPRQMAFGPGGGLLYVVSQRLSKVYVYRWQQEERRMLELLQTVDTLPPGYMGANAPSALRVSPDGTLLAVANRISDQITLYRIEPSGTLGKPVFCPLKGSLPRDIGFSRDGSFLIAAETATDTVSCYRVNGREPGLEWTHTCHVPAPAAVASGGEGWS